MIKPQRLLIILFCALLISTPALPGFAQDAPLILNYGETVSGFLTTRQLTQTWVFTGNEREIAQITAHRIGGQFAPHIQLFDANGALLAENTSRQLPDTDEVIFSAGLPVTGEYRIQVTSASALNDRVDNPNEYSLSLNLIGTRRNNLLETLPTIGTGEDLPPILVSDNLIAPEANPLNIALYNAGEPVRLSEGALYSIGSAAGDREIIANNARPLSRMIAAFSLLDNGVGFISTTNTVFFSDRSQITVEHEPESIVTVTLDGEIPQTIVTDFYNIVSIQAIENLVVVRLTSGQRLILSGSYIDLRRRAQQGINDEPVFEIRLDDNRFINTDLVGWHTLTYLDGQLRVLYSDDSQLISDQVRLDIFQNNVAPAFSDIALYDNLSSNSFVPTTLLRIDWAGTSSDENSGTFLIGDVVLSENSLRVLPLDGRDILENFTFSGDRRAVAELLIEQGAVRIHRADGTYRLSLPDATEITTVATVPIDVTAQPNEIGYAPQGLNNLGVEPMPLTPAQNPVADYLPVNPVNGNFYYAVQDFYVPSHTLELKFERYYNSQANALTPAYMLSNYPLGQMGQGWRHSYQFELDIAQAPLGQLTLILPEGTRHVFNVLEDGAHYRSSTLLSWTVERVGGVLGRWVATTTEGIQYHFDRAGRLQYIANADGQALTFSPMPREYGDVSGVFIVEPYGRRLELYTDANERISNVRDTLSRQITYSYNDTSLVGVQYIDFAQTASYSYDNSGLLITFNDAHSPYHQRGAISYNEAQRVVAYVENPDGAQPRRFDYIYDENRRVTTRATQVTTLNGETQQRTDVWQYDEQFLVTNYTAPRPEFTYSYAYDRDTHRLNAIRQPDQTTFRFAYDAQGYLTELRDPLYTDRSYQYTYEIRGTRQLLQEIRYPNGGRETFVYDDTPAAHLIEHRQLVSASPSVERIERFTYDEWGRVASAINAGANGEEVSTVYIYDAFGYVSSVQVGDSTALNYRHDILGRLRLVVDGNGNNYALDWSSTQNIVTAIYGPEGFTQNYGYDALGRLIEWNDRGNITRYSYSDLNQVVEITNAVDQITTFVYDEANNLLSTIQTGERTYLYTYDALNDLTSVTTPSGLTSVYSSGVEEGGSYTFRRAVDPAGRITVYRYDALGRLKRVTLITDDIQRPYELTYDSVGNMTSASDAYTGRNLEVTYDLIGQVISTSIENTVTNYTYDLAGNLLTVTDPSGLVTTYSHDVLGNVTGVLFADGTQQSYHYDANNNLASMIDALGQETTYVYDALNRVTSVVESGERTTQYAYDARSNLVAVTDASGNTRAATYDSLDRMISLTDAVGNQTTYQYDDLGRLTNINAPLGLTTQYAYNVDDSIVAVTQPSGRQTIYDYDVLGRLTSMTDALGHTYLYSYDQFGNLASVTDPLGNALQYAWRNGRPGTFTDGNGRSYQYNPDIEGRVITIRDLADGGINLLFDYDRAGRITGVHAGTDRLFSNSDETEWAYQYDEARGWLETYTDPAGNDWILTHDAAGRVIQVQDPDGVITGYEYNAAGNVSRIVYAGGTEAETNELFAYDANGNVIQHTTADGVMTTYAYDANNRLIEMREAVGTALERTSRYEYDAAGNLTRMIDPNGKETIYRYDPFGDLTRVILARGEQTIEYEYVYDLVGNLTSMVLPEGQRINISYDALNRRVRYVDAANGVWAYTYDNGGNLTQVSDPLGNVTRYVYDAYNRLSRIVYPDNSTVDLIYNQRGNFQNVIAPTTGNTDERERTEYTIDAAGNLITIEDNAGGDNSAQSQFTYNVRGQIISRETPTGEITQYRYDELGRLVEVTYPDASTQTRAYDAVGRLSAITSATGTINFAYDELGRLVEARTDDTTLVYTYDAADHLLSRTTEGIGAILYTYDDIYRPVEIRYGEQTLLQLVYDRNGWRTQLARSNGVTTNYTYDANGRPQFITHITENGDLVDGFSYLYDPVGNLTRIDRIDTWAILYNYSASERIIDERWLNEVNDARYSLSLNYDNAGNIIDATRDGVRTLYVYNEQNQLIGEIRNYNPTDSGDTSWLPIIALLAGGMVVGRKSWRRLLWASPVAMALLIVPTFQQQQAPIYDVTYSYREDGNLSQIVYTNSGNTLDFAYDFESRLIQVTGAREDGIPVDTHLTYDALGRLVQWQNGFESYRLIYDGETLVATENLSPQGETTRYFVPFPNEILLSVFGEDNPIWSLQDATRSTRMLIDDSGNVLDERFEFNVFGEPIAPYGQLAASNSSPYPSFAGELYDPTTELYLGDERAYDPTTNRYLQRSSERHYPRNNLYGEFNPLVLATTNQPDVPYRYLYEGAFAPQILDTVRPQTLLGSLLPQDNAITPNTAQLQLDENARILQIASRLNGHQSVINGFLSPLPNNPTTNESISIMLADHYTTNVGWLPNGVPNPLRLPNPQSSLTEAQSLITEDSDWFALPSLPDPLASVIQPEEELSTLLREVQIITGLLPEVQSLLSVQPDIALPNYPIIDVGIPEPRIVPPALQELYELYDSPLAEDVSIFPSIMPENQELTP